MQPDLKDDHWCFACGTENPHGLRLADIHLEGEECVCSFVPQPWHQGWAHIVHGGITATLLDEIMTHVLWRRGYDGVTAEMAVRFKRPVPVGEPLAVRARIVRRRGRLAETEGQVLLSDGSIAAQATAKFAVTERGPDQPGDRLSLAARQAVIFDLYGTLVPVYLRDEYLGMLAQMGEAVGMDGAAFIAAFRAGAPARTTGRWTDLAGNIRAVAADAGLSPTEDQIARAVQIRTEFTRNRLMSPYPDALEALAALRAAGRPVGVISDCSPETVALWPQSPLAEYVPDPVLSAAVGMRKPDPRIYELACQRMGVDPWRTVYVGDGDSNELEGASAVGLCPILVDRGETSAFRVNPSRAADIIVHDLTQLLPLIGVSS